MATSKRKSSKNETIDTESLNLADQIQAKLNSKFDLGNKLLSKYNGQLDNTAQYLEDINTSVEAINKTTKNNNDLTKKVSDLQSDISNRISEINKLKKAGADSKEIELKELGLTYLEEELENKNNLINQNEKNKQQLIDSLRLTENNADTLRDIAKSRENIGTSEYQSLNYSKEIEQIQNSIALAQQKGQTILEASLQDRLDLLKVAQREAEAQDKINSKIEAGRDKIVELGDKILNLVPGGKDGFLGKMLGLDTISKNLKDNVGSAMADAFANAGGGAKGFFTAASAGARSLMASLLPILPLLLAIAAVVGIVKLFMDADKEVSELAKNLNMSYKEAIALKGEAVDIAQEMNMVGVNSKEVVKQMVDLKQALGINIGKLAMTNKAARDLVETSTAMTAQYGLTAEETVNLNTAAAITGTTLAKIGITAEKMGDELVSSNQIMREIGKVSKGVLFNFKGNVVALARAVKQARMMGTTLNEMSQIGAGLMDIENSIAAANKARILTGRNINMDAARYFYMIGDTEKMMESIAQQMGSAAEYEKLGPMQRKAYAEALGMSIDQLDTMMAKQLELETLGYDAAKLEEIKTKAKDGQLNLQEELNKLGSDAAKQQLQAIYNEERRAGIQEKLGNTFQKITDLLFKMVEPLLPVIDSFVDSLGDGKSTLAGISSAFSAIGDILKNVIWPIVKITFAPLLMTIQGVKLEIEKIGGALSDAFGGSEGGASAFEMIGNILNGIFSVIMAIGKAMTTFFLAPILRIIKIAGGIYKIFTGDFQEGLKMIGDGILTFLLAPFEAVGVFIDELFGTNLVDSVKEIFSNIADAIFDILGGVWDVIKGIFTFDGDLILKGIESIGSGLYNALVQPFIDAWDWITGWFGGNSPSKLGDSILKGITSIGTMLVDAMTWPFRAVWDFVGDLFGVSNLGTGIVDSFKDIFSEIGDMIMQYLGGAWDMVSGIFTLDGDKILSGLKDLGGAIFDMITWPFTKAMNFIGKLFGVKELGSDIIKGIKSAAKKVLDVIIAPFKKAWDWISGMFGNVGSSIIDGLTGVASNIWNFITDPFKKAWDWITSLFSGIGGKIVDGLSNFGQSVWTSITGAFKSGYDWVVDTFSGVGGKIVDGISSVGGAIVDAITAPFTQAWDAVSGWLGFSPSELGNGIVKGISSVSGDVEANLTKPFDSAEKKVSDSAAAMADSVSGISGNASISISGIDTAGISQIKDIEKDLRKIKVDVIEEKLGELSDAFSAMDWNLLKEFANLASVNLADAGKSLIDGINSLTGISKSIKLESLEDTFDQLTDTLGTLDWEMLKTFASLATTNLKDAGKSLIDGINSLTGISDKINLSALEDTFEQLTDTLSELDWEALKVFSSFATTNLKDAGKSLIDGINSLTGISKEVNLSSLEDTFADLTDTLDELDWEALKIFASLATTNLANAGKSIIDGINSLAGIKSQINLDGAEDAFSTLNGVLDELDLDAITKFASLANNSLSTAATNIKTGLDTLSTVKDVTLDGVGDKFETLSNILDELDFDIIDKFATTDFSKLSTNVTAITTAMSNLTSVGSLDLSGISDKGKMMTSFLEDISEIDYSEIDGLADAILSLSAAYSDLSSSIKDITDEDLNRIQQVASVTGGSKSSGLSSFISGLFGNDEEDVQTSQVKSNTVVKPLMEETSKVVTTGVSTEPGPAAINSGTDMKNVEALLKELISKVNQPVQLKIGDGPIRDIQSAITLNRSYTANVNGFRV